VDNVNDPLNVCTVYIRVWQKENNAYLKPTFTSFSTNATQFEVGVSSNWIPITLTPGNWSLDTSTVVWQQTYNYRIEMYSQDKATNAQGSANTPASTGYFRFDSNPPSSTIQFPTNAASPNAYGLGSLNTLFGTSADGNGESGMSYVQYQLQDNKTGNWWCSTT